MIESNIPKQHKAPVPKAMARPPAHQSASAPLLISQAPVKSDSRAQDEKEQAVLARHGEEDIHSSLFAQVYDWLQFEKSRRNAHKMKVATPSTDGAGDGDGFHALERTTSQSSEASAALGKLENILLQYAEKRHERHVARRRHYIKGLRRGSVSESDHPDVDAEPPAVDAFLDNTKTLGYSGGAADGREDESSASSRQAKDKEHWLKFKTDILRIVLTLRIKGWRRVSMEDARDLDVVRLSGALTNAVYVVAPPPSPSVPKTENSSPTLVPRKPPPKLLLRIYGPQVEHLIDREKELQVLRRLGRKNIGPQVLGTFKNGRFEQYFHARPLKPEDLRVPETYKQIAKRMRELHEGVELQEQEREDGPIVFKNWDKWVDRCDQVVNWLDREIQSNQNESKAQTEPWRRRGFVCGVPWPVFRKAVENYRKWLIASCGGADEIKRQLVFAHNDTQYGNLLRLEPTGDSPLLTPANEHKQLIVIDFEYASANTPGFEFANHFTEWGYNYHDPERPWAFNGKCYPKPEEQHRFITEYLKHKPGMSFASPFTTPHMQAASGITPRLAPLDLDAEMITNTDQRPPVSNESDNVREDGLEADIQFFMRQTRLWRVFNSAQWVAWGIVQAKVAGMEQGIEAMTKEAEAETDGGKESSKSTTDAASSPVDANSGVDSEDEFDYLAYAQDRAIFFWADVLTLGLVKEDELPRELVECAKARAFAY